MPTVRDGIEPLAVFPTPKGKNGVKRLSVFPAEHWEKWGGEPGLYRVMLGQAWVTRADERVSFYDEEGLGEVIRRWGLGALGCEGNPRPGSVLPDAPPLTYVWAMQENGVPLATRTLTHPFKDSAGDWRVWVYMMPAPVPLDHLSSRKRGEGVGAY